MTPLSAVGHLAVRELAAHLKSRWILITGSVCALLSWIIAFHGFAFTGGAVGQQTVLVSLVHLQLYIIPLLGLLLAYDSVLAERDSGMFDLHLALGVSPWSFIAGKWIGLLASLWIALAPSLAIQGAGLLAAGGEAGQWARLLLYAALLSGAVVSAGVFLSGLSLNRGTVISLCVGLWLLQAVLLDFVVIGLLAATDGDISPLAVHILIVGHPLGAYRLLSYLAFFPDQLTALLHTPGMAPAVAYLLLALWTALPLALTGYGLTRTAQPVPLRPSP